MVAKDVAESLGYTWQPAVIKHVPEEWKGIIPCNTPSGIQDMLTLTEQGLYFFLGRSNKPKALPFQKWIAGDVLPALRKTGTYALPCNPPKPTHSTPTDDRTLVYALRVFNQCHDAWAKHVAANHLSSLCQRMGLEIPDRALLGKPAQLSLNF